jgi:hypothetical protein
MQTNKVENAGMSHWGLESVLQYNEIDCAALSSKNSMRLGCCCFDM